MYKNVIVLAAILALVMGGCNGRPKTKEELLKAGIEQMEAKNPGVAVIYFKNALEKDQNFTEARFRLAKVYSSVGKCEAAEKEFQKVLLQRPGMREAQIGLAGAFAMNGKPDEALKATTRIDNAENDVEILEISGWAHAQKADYETAVTQLKKSLTLEPGRTRALLLLSRVYLLQGKAEAAREPIAELLKKDPSHREGLYLLAEAQVMEKDREGAVKTYDVIIEKFPGDASGFFRKGLLLVDQQRDDEALRLSDQLIKKFPNQGEGYELKGITLFDQKNYKEAVSLLQKTLAFKASARVHYLVGLCNFYNNELELAMSETQRALSLDPDFGKARIIASLIYLKKNKMDEAIDEIRKVLAKQDNNAAAHSVLGSAYLGKGQYNEGIAELNRALEIDPSLADAHLKKGAFQLSRGRTSEAEAELDAALRSNPDLLNGRLMLASHYVKRNQPGKAIATARAGLRNIKTDALLYNVMADAFLQEQKTKDAMSVLEKAKQADPGYATTYFKMAALLKLEGDQEKPFQLLKTFAETFPDNVQGQVAVAATLETRGNDSDARAFYDRASKTGRPEGAIEAGRYYVRKGKPEKAEALLEESYRKNPGVAALCIARGETYLGHKKFGDALQAFEDLAKQEPDAGLAGIINTYLAMNKPEKALERVQREMEAKPDRAELQAEESRIYTRMNRREEAAESARRLIRREPGSALGYIALAISYESANELDKATEVLKSASRIRDAKLALMLGNLYSLRKNYALALAEYQKAQTIQAGYVPAIFQKASTLHLMGKKREAIAEYQQVLKLSPGHVPALNNLAYLLAQEPDGASAALQYAVQAYTLAPREAAVQDTFGFVLLKKGKIEEGLKALKQAAAAGADPGVYYHLALALKEHKETTEAAAYLRKAIDIGNFAELAQAKALLAELNRRAGR